MYAQCQASRTRSPRRHSVAAAQVVQSYCESAPGKAHRGEASHSRSASRLSRLNPVAVAFFFVAPFAIFFPFPGICNRPGKNLLAFLLRLESGYWTKQTTP